MTLRGLVLVLFTYLGHRIVLPISSLFAEINFRFPLFLNMALTLITASLLTKVFLIVFPVQSKKKDRFLFLPLSIWSNIYLYMGIFYTIIWWFIK